MSWFFKQDLRHTKQQEVGWTPYSPEESKKIEKAFAKGQKKLKLNATYSVCFDGEGEDGKKAMFQFRNDDFQRQRPVMREEPSKGSDDDEEEVKQPPKKKAKTETKAVATKEEKKKPAKKAAAASAGAGAGSGAGGKVFAGMTFCLTGTLSMLKAKVEKMIKDNGGKVAGSVTKAVTHVVAAALGTGKADKAAEDGLPVLKESWLQASIDAGKPSTDKKHFLANGGGDDGGDDDGDAEMKSEAAASDKDDDDHGDTKPAEVKKTSSSGAGAGAGAAAAGAGAGGSGGKWNIFTGGTPLDAPALIALVRQHAGKPYLKVGKPATDAEIAEAEKELGHPLPPPLRELYKAFSFVMTVEGGGAGGDEDGSGSDGDDGDKKKKAGGKKGGAGAAAGGKPLAGKVFCLTGKMEKVRAKIIADIQKAGGTVANSMTKAVTHLVMGPDVEGTTKHTKALEAGVKILSEEGLEALMSGEGSGDDDDDDGDKKKAGGKKRKRDDDDGDDDDDDDEEDGGDGDESDGFDSDGMIATPLLFGLLKAPEGDDEFNDAVLTKFNKKIRNESEDAVEKCALWNHFVSFGTEAGGHWVEHDVPQWAVRIADNGVVRPQHYLWDVEDPTTELRPLKKPLVKVWKTLILRAKKGES